MVVGIVVNIVVVIPRLSIHGKLCLVSFYERHMCRSIAHPPLFEVQCTFARTTIQHRNTHTRGENQSERETDRHRQREREKYKGRERVCWTRANECYYDNNTTVRSSRTAAAANDRVFFLLVSFLAAASFRANPAPLKSTKTSRSSVSLTKRQLVHNSWCFLICSRTQVVRRLCMILG